MLSGAHLMKNTKSDTGSSGSYDQSYDDPNSYANPYDPGYSSPSVDSGKILKWGSYQSIK